ncbi:MAG: hypothetical protein ISQ75_03865, partial [Puniceicoccaceae bacterium]|nr:hypothetical protein [Puniceicoccaceae bacterium]
VFTAIPSHDSDVRLNIGARVLTEKMMEDVRLENNVKAVVFRPAR